MALLHPDAVELSAEGLPGNRRFYLIDDGGELFSTYDHGPLVQIEPTYDHLAEHLTLRFPEGEQVEGSVSVLGDQVVTNFHGRPVGGRLVAGPFADAVSSFVGEPLRLVRTDRDGEGSDVEPLTLISQESVRDLSTRGRYEGALDSRRFRIDVELAGCEPYEEDAWQGHKVRLGEAEVRVLGQIPRCRVTQQSPDTGIRDWNTLTQIAKYRPRIAGDGGIPFGVYARVEQPGLVRVGAAADALIPV